MKLSIKPIHFLGRERFGVYDAHGTLRQWATEQADAIGAKRQIERREKELARLLSRRKDKEEGNE